MLPPQFLPSDTLLVKHEGRTLALPLHRTRFTAAREVNGVHTFGGKALVEVDGRAQVAEVAILRAFEEAGWQGRWVETYAKPALCPGLWRAWQAEGPTAQVHLSIEEAWVNEHLERIAAANGNTYSGCWDVVVWKNDRLLFVESKRAKRDALRDTQLRWREAALRCGCMEGDFVVVEWELFG